MRPGGTGSLCRVHGALAYCEDLVLLREMFCPSTQTSCLSVGGTGYVRCAIVETSVGSQDGLLLLYCLQCPYWVKGDLPCGDTTTQDEGIRTGWCMDNGARVVR